MGSNTDVALAIVVVSCDSYRDLWPLCTAMIKRFWPDCPYPIYLISNLPVSIGGLRNIAVGPDCGWSANLLSALAQIEEEYVLLFLEDLILEQPVPTKRVLELVDWFSREQGNCLRMNPNPPPDKPCNDLVGLLCRGELYRASTVMTLWRKEILRTLLRPEENAWEFEIRGSERSDQFEGFYASNRRTFAVVNTIGRGKWSRRALKRIRRLGVKPDLTLRERLSRTAEWKGRMMEIRSAILQQLPSNWRRSIRKTILG
jgi:hypothetical protein